MNSNPDADQFEEFNSRWNLELSIPTLIEALTHPSYKSVNPIIYDNQRLETLGDAVIDLLVVDWLYRHQAKDEGVLTKSRAEIVQNETLSKIGKKMQIHQVLRCAAAYKIHPKDLADAVESIFGAKYLEGGLNSCQSLFLFLFEDDLTRILANEEKGMQKWGRNENNPKNIVNEFFQKRNLPVPTYKLLKREGSDHDPKYCYSCEGMYQNSILQGTGCGKTKKVAQKQAATDFYQKLLTVIKNSSSNIK